MRALVSFIMNGKVNTESHEQALLLLTKTKIGPTCDRYMYDYTVNSA